MFEDLYKNVFGRAVARVLASPVFSYAAGKFLDSRPSRFLIKPFIKKNLIDLTDVEDREFSCFNAFFTRRLVDGARPVDADEAALVSPCDGLLSAFPIEENGSFSIKSSHYRLCDLVQDEKLAAEYYGGQCLIFRLRASDYHRYAFAADGYIGENHYIEGQLHSVQPIACEKYPVYRLNRRCWHLIETEEFGPLVQIEVGAMAVGSIVTELENAKCVRGEEMGHFELCGSTIVLLIRKGEAQLRPELLRALEQSSEIPVHRGMWIATALH